MPTTVLEQAISQPDEQPERAEPSEDTYRRHITVHPLVIVLVLQACLSLRLLWSNTAFADESLYLWADT